MKKIHFQQNFRKISTKFQFNSSDFSVLAEKFIFSEISANFQQFAEMFPKCGIISTKFVHQRMNNAIKSFNILAISLSDLHNYF